MDTNNQVIQKPTFYQNIRPMFSQYDQVMMMSSGRGFDLFDYDSVKSMASQIHLALQPSDDPSMAQGGWSKLQQVHVMPEIGGPWPDSWVETFKNWIDTGCPAGTDPAPTMDPVADDTLQSFIALSKALTGIDQFFRFNIYKPDVIKQLEENLATIYYYRLKNWVNADGAVDPDAINKAIKAWDDNPNAADVAANNPICTDIIGIWYNTSTSFDGYGSPDFNQYKEGQVWKACLIHPIGYAPENTAFYWQNEPSENGEYSGFYFVNY